MSFRDFSEYLLLLQAAAAAFAVARLLQFRLAGRLPLLFSYLLVITFNSLVLGMLNVNSPAYFRAFLIGEPIDIIAAALTVYEMFALIFRDYPGLRTAGRWALYVALAISFSVSLYIAITMRGGGSPRVRWLLYELVVDRSFHFGLAVIIIIQLIFLSRYPLHLERNILVASGFFGALFLSEAAVSLIDSLSPHLIARYVDYPELVFSALCLAGLGLLLVPATARQVSRVAGTSDREITLLQQLDAMDKVLARSARR